MTQNQIDKMFENYIADHTKDQKIENLSRQNDELNSRNAKLLQKLKISRRKSIKWPTYLVLLTSFSVLGTGIWQHYKAYEYKQGYLAEKIKEIESLTVENKQLSNSNKNLEQLVSSSKLEISSLESKNKELDLEVAKLLMLISDYKVDSGKLQDMIPYVQELENRVKSIPELNEYIEELESKNKELEKKLKSDSDKIIHYSNTLKKKLFDGFNSKDDRYMLIDYISDLLFATRNYKEVIAVNFALEKTKPHFRDLFELAYSYDQLGKTEKARQVYEKLLIDNPRHASANNNLGVIYSKKGNYKKALNLYADALALDPSKELYANNIAVIWSEVNDSYFKNNLYARINNLQTTEDIKKKIKGLRK